MEIRTGRPREAQEEKGLSTRAPHPRKKTVQKIGKGPIAGRRVFSALKALAKIGAFLLMVAFALSAFIYTYTSERFNLKTVTIYGCKETNPKRLEAMIRREFPTNILRIDLRHLKSRLQKEAWVKEAEIRRILPSELVIYLQERLPSVILELHGELMLADREGVLLDTYDPRYGKLDVPVFKGVLGEDAESYRQNEDENAARIRQGLEMLAEIETGLPSYTRKISEVDISDRNNLKILLVDDTAEVYLGEKDYCRRFRNLMENLGQYADLKSQYSTEVASVDLRFAGQIVYHFRGAREESKKLERSSRIGFLQP
jgi:cell division protein FtsQ